MDANIVACANSFALKKIKAIFRANKSTDLFDKNYFNIAVHVRRPNAQDNREEGTNVSDQFFLKVINRLREIYYKQKPLFHIISQGNKANFERFYANDTILHINESLEDSFILMVFADALVTSASSFSYAAALLSEGKVYHMPFWHNPLPDWTNVTALL